VQKDFSYDNGVTVPQSSHRDQYPRTPRFSKEKKETTGKQMHFGLQPLDSKKASGAGPDRHAMPHVPVGFSSTSF
jgi:hypothetical protein